MMDNQELWLGDVRAALAEKNSERLAGLLSHRSVEDLISVLDAFQDHTSILFQSMQAESAADALEEVHPEHARDMLEDLPHETAADVLDEMEDDHASDVLLAMSPGTAADLLEGMAPEDIADVLEIVPTSRAAELLGQFSLDVAADVLEEMGEDEASDILEALAPEKAADILEVVNPREAADLLQEMDEDTAADMLARVDPDERTDIAELMSHPDDSIGGQMSIEFLALTMDRTVAEAIEAIRQWAEDSESPHYLYVTGDRGELLGVVPLHRLVTASPTISIADLMLDDVVRVKVDEDQEEAARLFRKYHYLALPVVDDNNVLEGVVRVDDVGEVIEEEAAEDANVMVGLPHQEQIFAPVFQSARRRITWLTVNLLTALLAAGVVSLFENTIARLSVLAVMMPIVAGQGGNAGSQTLTIMVRGLALGEIDRRGAWRAFWKELGVGALNGLAIGFLVGAVMWLWQGSILLGAIIAVAMLLNLTCAAGAGVVVPLGLRAIGVDPALASAIFVTTVTDCCGFLFFLGLATLALRFLI